MAARITTLLSALASRSISALAFSLSVQTWAAANTTKMIPSGGRRPGDTVLNERAQQPGPDTAHRRADGHDGGRSGITIPPRGVCAGSPAIGLDRRPKRPCRLPLGGSNADNMRKYAAELVALAPDVILAHS